MVGEFTILNGKDITILFDGTDNYQNLNVTHGTLTDQIENSTTVRLK